MTQIQYSNEHSFMPVFFFFAKGDDAVLSVLLKNTEEYFICLCDTSIITWTSILRRCFTSYLKGFTSSTVPVWTVPVRQGYQTINEGCNPAGFLDLPDRKGPSPWRVGTQVKELSTWAENPADCSPHLKAPLLWGIKRVITPEPYEQRYHLTYHHC